MTIFLNQTLVLPFNKLIINRELVNVSFLGGNSACNLILYGMAGEQQTYSVQAGQMIRQEKYRLYAFEVQGSGNAAITISYPEIIEPTIEITLNPNLPQTITSPQLPASLDTNGHFIIRHLDSNDAPLLASAATSNQGISVSLTTANTAQQIIASSTLIRHFQIRNTSSSTVYIGTSTIQAVLLFPNSMYLWDAVASEITDLSTWYFNSGTAGASIEVNYQA